LVLRMEMKSKNKYFEYLDILKKNLSGILRSEEIQNIATQMSESWDSIAAEWGDVNLNNLSKNEYIKRINRLAKHFSIYLTDKVKIGVIKSIYEKCFAHVRPSNAPFLLITTEKIDGNTIISDFIDPAKYGSNFGLVSKTAIKESSFFYEFLNDRFGPKNGDLIRDYMLAMANYIAPIAIDNKKSFILEQSGNTGDFYNICVYAKQNNFRVYIEIEEIFCDMLPPPNA